ncbi:MAG: flagellar basal body-associated FliL family protein [bacterium]|nr:flagellar basal body-associated FliL family protein [bacterium]
MAENENEISNGKGKDINKYFLLITLISVVIVSVVFAGVNYLVVDNLVSQKLNKLSASQEELDESEEGEEDEIQRGIIVDLGDFILNLCDETQKKYLKVNVAIEVTKKDDDFSPAEVAPAKGGHGEEAPAAPDPMSAIQEEMNQFKPAIRDAVITTLSSKTSAELSSAAGKELSKEQITNEINSILGGEREVLRVSFGQFIIQ